MIELRDVTLVRDGNTLLHHIDWTIGGGERWILYGHNGSGKSLTLQIIEGYLWPSSGHVNWFGTPAGSIDTREMRKLTGYFGQAVKNLIRANADVMSLIIGGKFATVGLFDDYSPEDKRRAEELIALTGCTGLEERTYSTLSDGEKARALIARSLMPSPKLLVLDEPCAGLDIAGREMLLKVLSDVGASHPGMSILFVTHHVEEIIPDFTKIIILKKGRVFRRGSTHEILSADVLSEALGIHLELGNENNRYWCKLKSEPA
jgi:iron complex transport system ATP-binding protein